MFTTAQQQSDVVCFNSKPEFIEKLKACWEKGPLEICAEKIGSIIVVTVKLSGIVIAEGNLTSSSNALSASVNVGLVKADASIKADFVAKKVLAEGEVCTRNLVKWDCDGFSAVILSW